MTSFSLFEKPDSAILVKQWCQFGMGLSALTNGRWGKCYVLNRYLCNSVTLVIQKLHTSLSLADDDILKQFSSSANNHNLMYRSITR